MERADGGQRPRSGSDQTDPRKGSPEPGDICFGVESPEDARQQMTAGRSAPERPFPQPPSSGPQQGDRRDPLAVGWPTARDASGALNAPRLRCGVKETEPLARPRRRRPFLDSTIAKICSCEGPYASPGRPHFVLCRAERMGAIRMPERRELYRSPNGDSWFLGREPANGHAFVIHQPDAPSGGRLSHIELGEFLRSGAGPEQQALLRLIGTLVEVPPYAHRT
jgi:hypothetical protein